MPICDVMTLTMALYFLMTYILFLLAFIDLDVLQVINVWSLVTNFTAFFSSLIFGFGLIGAGPRHKDHIFK